MDYFVSAENTPYHQWQLELLIESFKRHNRAGDLFVALAQTEAPMNPFFCRNLFNHDRIWAHQNIGAARGFRPLNQLYALTWAVQFEKVSQPFVQMSPDMVLYQPTDVRFVMDGLPEIVVAPSPFFTLENAEEAVGPFWEALGTTRSEYEGRWLPTGPLMAFNNVPQMVFERTIWMAERLAFQQLYDGRERIWEHTTQLAWAVNLADYIGQIMIRGDYSLTTTMLEANYCPFINYEHGLPPVFNKAMFSFPPPTYASFGDPFEVLAVHAPTPTSHFMSQLAQANLDSRKPKVVELET